MLLPTNIAPMNLEGLFKKFEIIFAKKSPCLPSSSIFSLFADTKAISIPEKKAEKTSVLRITPHR